jgi:hypothetical protein
VRPWPMRLWHAVAAVAAASSATATTAMVLNAAAATIIGGHMFHATARMPQDHRESAVY